MGLENNFEFIVAKYENGNINFEINFKNNTYLGKKVSIDLYYGVKINDSKPVSKIVQCFLLPRPKGSGL